MQLSILGLDFEISAPYAEGHVCTPAEARTLNQTRKENISNALRKKIDELKTDITAEDGTVSKAFTAEAASQAAAIVAEFDATYVFSSGATGSTKAPVDPVEKEALVIAKAKVTEAILKKGLKVKDYDKEAFNAKVAEVAAMPKVIAEAQRRIKQRANLDLDVELA